MRCHIKNQTGSFSTSSFLKKRKTLQDLEDLGILLIVARLNKEEAAKKQQLKTDQLTYGKYRRVTT